MRIHARPNHPSYREDIASFDVKLNGFAVEPGSCIFADEESGVVELVVRDLGGTPLHFGAEILTETKRGKVEIIQRLVTDDSHSTRSPGLELNGGTA